tara:strand:- start:72 stop:356 length:285 start_codon:yes stop_codon:yes gene_type:complete
MSLEKNIFVDKCETVAINVGSHYVIQVRERHQILENGREISASFNRYVLNPDADTSAISDPVVLAQFNAVMTDEVKANYQTFLASQEPVTEENE